MISKELEHQLVKLPELISGKGVWQNPFHEYDIYNHTLKVAAVMKKHTQDPDLITAAYLHDIAKPSVKKLQYINNILQEKQSGKPYHDFDNHEAVGKNMILKMKQKMFKKYHLNQNKIALLVGLHYDPMMGIKTLRQESSYEGFCKKFNKLDARLSSLKGGISKDDILLLFLADKLGQGKKVPDIKELLLVREALLEKSISKRYSLMEKIYSMQRKYIKSKNKHR